MTIDPAIWNSLTVALAAILLDTIAGVLISVKNGTFSLSKAPQFLVTNVFPYLGGLIVLAVFANYIEEFSALFYIGTGLVALKFSKEAIIDKLRTLFA